MANPYDDDQMFLRHIRQQLLDAQKGGLINDQLMNSLNRPNNIQNPFFTQTIPGNSGAFASPQPLNYPGSTIPKTTPGAPPQVGPMNSGPKPFMMPQTPDPRLQNSAYSIPNIIKSLLSGGVKKEPTPSYPPGSPMDQFLKLQRPGIDPVTRQWDREDQLNK